MPHPLHTSLRRATALLIALSFGTTACTAGPAWPTPDPRADPEQTAPGYAPPPRLTQPDFKAPSATHCARPVETYEVPGTVPRPQPLPWPRHGAAPSDAMKRAAPTPAPTAALAPALPSPSVAASVEMAASGARGEVAEAAAAPAPPPGAQRQPTPAMPVTAGMVDDNAAFSEYLAFLQRTPVASRPRDVRERHLLEVKDAAGRPVHDAEVLVRASGGPGSATMWARTDTAGRVWLHPDAFDASRSRFYEVHARKGGQQAQAVLERGRQSALELRLDARPAARAQLDLVFLIDATGSMADEIDKLRASMQSIAQEVAQLPSRPDLCFGLVAYRDKTDDFVLRAHDFTNDLGAFQRVLDGLRAAGGGDYPEAMNEALHETVHRLRWRGAGTARLVVLLADAPPHLDYGGPQYDVDMLAALGKGIKIFSVGASGLDKQGEVIQRQIAQYTGGRFVFLTYAQAANPGSGPGRETVHDVRNYSVETLDRLVVRLIREELAPLQDSRRGG